MPIKVWHSGQWVETDDVFVGSPSARRQVLAAYVYTRLLPGGRTGALHWEPLFDNYQEPPANLRITSPATVHTSATVAWDAAPKATEYQVVVRSPTGTTYYPSATTWTSELSYPVQPLLQDTRYTITVLARRFNADGVPITGGESKVLTLNTGHAASPLTQNPEYPAAKTVYVSASSSNTWNKDQKWSSSSSTGSTYDVVQGYFTYPVRNNYGGVYYGGVYTSLVSQLGKDPAGKAVADNVEVTDAKINRVLRRTGGSGNPVVNVYASKLNFSSTAAPDNVGAGTSFTAPDEGAFKDNFDFADTNKLRDWVRVWAAPTYKSAAHNGLLIFRTGGTGNATAGYNGFCIFRNANASAPEWRLVLSVRWSYVAVPEQPATWS